MSRELAGAKDEWFDAFNRPIPPEIINSSYLGLGCSVYNPPTPNIDSNLLIPYAATLPKGLLQELIPFGIALLKGLAIWYMKSHH